MSRPEHTRRGRVALVAVAVMLALVGGAGAQQLDTSAADQFGGFADLARSNGVQVTYDSPGTFPFSPVIQLSLPETLTTLSSGPSAYALSSVAFPGPLLGNLPAVIEQSGNEPPPGVEPYDVKAEASSPAGPFEDQQSQGPANQSARADGVDSVARTSYSGVAAAPVIDAGSIVSTSQSTIDGPELVARTRSEVSDLTLFNGLLKIESVVTDLVAVSNGEESATAGRTTVSGVTVLGLAGEVDADGFRFTEAPPDPGDPSGGPLGDLGDALDPVTDPLNDLLATLDGPRDEVLQQLFDQSGIRIRLAQPNEQTAGGFGERSVDGLLIESTYDGKTTPVFSQLLALVPAEDLPNEYPPDIQERLPLNASPQAMVNLMKDTHINALAIAPGTVSVNATPAFAFDPPSITPGPSDSFDAGGAPGLGSTGDFASPTPDLGGAGTNGAAGPATGPSLGGTGLLAVGAALPAAAILFAALGAPFFAIGSRRLADNTLDAVTSSCPEGLDGPDPGPEEP